MIYALHILSEGTLESIKIGEDVASGGETNGTARNAKPSRGRVTVVARVPHFYRVLNTEMSTPHPKIVDFERNNVLAT